MLTPHPHQADAVQALFTALEKPQSCPLGVAPVAAGKTLIYCEFIRQAIEKYPGSNFIVLSHVAELLTQGEAELKTQYPQANISKYGAKLGQRSLQGQIIFASIQTIYSHAYDIPHTVHIVILDEAHLLSPTDGTMYQRFLGDLRKINPRVRLVGLTGTPFRVGQGYLHRGKGSLFTDIAFNIPMTKLMAEGFLCPISTPNTHTRLPTAGVGMTNGDYKQGELERSVDQSSVTEACVKEIIAHGTGQYGPMRKKWLVFCAGIKHAEHTCEAFKRHDISCGLVTGKTPKNERSAILHSLKHGDLQCVVNVATLTTGINIPAIDLVAFMRPTRSPVLYTQCVGRALRVHPGKKDAICLDFGGVVRAMGPVDQLVISEHQGGNGEAVMKICPECHEYLYSAMRRCGFCNHEFPPPDVNGKLSSRASDAALLSSQIKPQSLAVKSWRLIEHEKPGKPLSMRVEYNLGISKHSEYVTIQHFGEARNRAVIWWAEHKGQLPPPTLVSDAISRQKELTMPRAIILAPNGKYQEIVGREW